MPIFKAVADPVEYPQIEIDDLVPLKDHKFKLYEGDKLNNLVQSIKERGILSAVIVRNIIGTSAYEILSGHNRVNAAKLAGLQTIPCYIVEVDDDEAKLIATETNFCQRSLEEMSYSERAGAIAQWHEAIKSQGKRTDLLNEIRKLANTDEIGTNETCCQIGTFAKSAEKSAEKFDLSTRNIFRYLRINSLISELKNRLDDDEFPFNAAVNLSYLKHDKQQLLQEVLSNNENLSLSLFNTEALKSCAKAGKLNSTEDVVSVITGEKKMKKENSSLQKVILKSKFLSNYFAPNKSEKEITAEVEKAIVLREVTIPALLAEYKSTENAEEITEKALKFYLENN